jgi:hypothetical protein
MNMGIEGMDREIIYSSSPDGMEETSVLSEEAQV